uniref:C1q domain-containing protein n=1 Tax=Daphnia galeata TaxID=27404 RepID=A0A8J2RM34_9CRUS|nr:unnamed protein product [Daphnia galeata]
MNDLPSSELKSSDPLTDSASSVARDDKPPPTKVISSLQYGQVCVSIYESFQTTLNNKNIYFYSPIAQLNHLDVSNQVSPTQGILSIGFTIWNETVTDKVVQHLTQFLKEKVEPNQVKVFPFTSVRLTSKVQSVDFSLTNEWQTFDKTRTKIRLLLTCPTKQDCDQIKNQMRSNPKKFQHLRLEFNPKLNDDTCASSGVGIAQEDFSKQLEEAKQELWANFEAKLVKELKTFREVASENLEKTRNELTQTKTDLSHLTTKLNLSQKELDLIRNELIKMSSIDRTNEIVDIGQMPTSCADLEKMGHKLSGFFSVRGSKKMEMVYCNFYSNQNEKQKWIGYTDVKSAPVHFYVQRSSSFNTMGIPIPWDVAVVNEGNAMDLTTGKFTAPRPGIYFFSFTGLAEFPASSSSLVRLAVAVYWNGDRLGAGFVEESNTLENQNSPLNFQSTLNLKKNDQVWLQIDAVTSGDDSLYDDAFHYTHFTGFVLEEEIVDSLI